MRATGLTIAATLLSNTGPAIGQTATAPWLDRMKTVEQRVESVMSVMTEEEKLGLLLSISRDPANAPDDLVPPHLKARAAAGFIKGSGGFVPGVPRLGIPDLTETDASMGVRNENIPSTALPSSLTTAASFDPAIAEMGGLMIGAEARATGHNVLLAGGANLTREPRNGRNFEYTGEDPLLAGMMTGALIRGVQSNGVMASLKHFAINNQEIQRMTLDVTISAAAMRQSELLAFEIANEQGRPASVMCSYNLVNGSWACENHYLLTKVLKQDWGFKGFVMSDWGATHSTADAINNGLDQQSGFDGKPDDGFFTAKRIREAVAAGQVPASRVDDMVRRVLWGMFSTGAVDKLAKPGPINYSANAAIAQKAAEDSLVLLKNDRKLLPLDKVKTLAVIGGKADKGVMAGGGSSAVHPVGGSPVRGARIYMPSSPVDALKRELPKARISFDSGDDVDGAAAAAAKADAAIIFVTQYMIEGFDGQLELGGNQDALITAVARANPNTIVVIESGGAVLMPWKDQVPAILAAFYPGIRGGDAIARILTGKVNPSGHLPISFPASIDQLAHPVIPGSDRRGLSPANATYSDGAAIGYKWYDLKGSKPLFAFGHGMSYTDFAFSHLTAKTEGTALKVSFRISNTGKRGGKGVGQVYVAADKWQKADWEAPKRLAGFSKQYLKPGQSRMVNLTIDRRLLASYQAAGNNWSIKAGTYRISLGQSSADLPVSVDIELPDAKWSAAQVAAR